MNISVVVFFLYIILYAVSAEVIFSNTGREKSKADTIIKKYFKKICIGGSVLSMVLFLTDLTGLVKMNGCGFIAVINFIMFVMAWFSGNIKGSEKKQCISKLLFRCFTVCIALETFVFNINSAHLLSGGYDFTELDISSADIQNFNTVSRQNEEGGNTVIEFKGLNIPVGTLYFSAESDKKSTVNFSIDMSDDTNSAGYRWGVASAKVIRGNERSRTVPCNFSGSVHDLRISFSADDDETITLNRISANKPVMFRFSVIRFLIMIGAGIIFYALTSPKMFFRKYSEVQRQTDITAKIFTVLLVMFSLFVTNMARYNDPGHSISKDFGSEWGNQITKEIVDSFENGRVDIMTDMNEKLLELDNPYDWSQRNDEVGSYPWDHLLFEGKYYSYYGIAPVLTLFLPYHKITGYYFPSCWAVFLFSAFGIIFLTKFYLCFADKFFKNTCASLILSGLVIMQLSTGVILCNFSPLFYEIAQTAGFVCVTAGAYFLMSSNVLGDGKIVNWRLAVSAVWLSLGVLSRPTVAVYCMAAMILIYAGFRKKKSEYDKKQPASKYYIPYFACALVPYIVIGSVQVWYNCARFGNPLDFGIQYSLTINDFTRSQYHTHFAAAGFWGFLFQLPAFTETFPFFRADSIQLFSPQGYYFIATGAALGLIWKALPTAAYTNSLKAYRYSQNSNKILHTVIITAVCLVCPFAVIFSIWESGFAARYCVDFVWQMITGALIICFIIHDKCAENTKIHLNKLMTGSVFLSILMNTVQLWSYIKPEEGFNVEWQAKAISFARLFEFWK